MGLALLPLPHCRRGLDAVQSMLIELFNSRRHSIMSGIADSFHFTVPKRQPAQESLDKNGGKKHWRHHENSCR